MLALSTVVRITDLFGADRMDAEFYQPLYHNNFKILKNNMKYVYLGDICKPKKGIFSIKADEYVEDGVPFIRISNLKDGLIDQDNLVHITEIRNRQSSTTSLKKYDIVLSKTAYPAASLIQIERCNCSQDIIAIKTSHNEELNFYIAAFLNTKYGFLQMERIFQGNIQQHISLEDIKTLIIPIPNEKFIKKIKSMYIKYIDLRKNSGECLVKANNIYIKDIDFKTDKLNSKNTYVAMLSTINKYNRLDPDFYQYELQRLIMHLNSSDKKIKNISKIIKNKFIPDKNKYFDYIEISDILKNGYVKSKKILGKNAPSRATWIVNKFDVITSLVRPNLTITGLIRENQQNYICTSGFAVLRPRGIPSELLFTYLRLPIITNLMNMYTTATMYPAISVKDLMELPFFSPQEQITSEIKSQIMLSQRYYHISNILFKQMINLIETEVGG